MTAHEQIAALRAELTAQRKLTNAILESIQANVVSPDLKGWKDGYIAGLKVNVHLIDMVLELAA
jgi:predicted ATP-dependent serine protease